MYEREKNLRKVFFVIPALHGGGAERVVVNILKFIDRNKFKPVIVLFKKKGEFLPEISPDVRLEVLDAKFIVPLRLMRLLKREQPDVLVSFMWYTNFVVLSSRILSRLKCRVIVNERSELSLSYKNQLKEMLRRIIIHFLYRYSDRIIANSSIMGFQLKKMLRRLPEKVAVIYNPVDIQMISGMSFSEVEHSWFKEKVPIIVSAGRLSVEKGFSYLLKSVSILATEGTDCRLVILGKGKEDDRLKSLASELGIKNKIAFLGFQENPYKYLANSTVFVLSSLYEGFPNVLLEAMALGVPSVATRCLTGPEEIIVDGVNGLLVPPADEKELADAIKRLLNDEDLRRRLGEAGRKRAEDFRVDKIVSQYEKVIEDVCAESADR